MLLAFAPVTVLALLTTLVLIFAFQAENIAARWFHVVLIAIPILIQVYFNSSLTYGLMRLFKVPYAVAAPGYSSPGGPLFTSSSLTRTSMVMAPSPPP